MAGFWSKSDGRFAESADTHEGQVQATLIVTVLFGAFAHCYSSRPIGISPGQSTHPRTQPEQVALHAERAAATRRAVANLGEPYREVVSLRFFGERSLDEIAILTGRPLGTVKTHLRRGLLRLRDQIDPGVAS